MPFFAEKTMLGENFSNFFSGRNEPILFCAVIYEKLFPRSNGSRKIGVQKVNFQNCQKSEGKNIEEKAKHTLAKLEQ